MRLRPRPVPGGAHRPGPGPTRGAAAPDRAVDSGAVAVEAAAGVAGLVLVAVALAGVLGVLGAELALGSAARAAARVAARGEADPAVAREARSLVPEADVRVSRDGDHVRVVCRRDLRPPGLLDRLGPVQLEAESVALVEQP